MAIYYMSVIDRRNLESLGFWNMHGTVLQKDLFYDIDVNGKKLYMILKFYYNKYFVKSE